MTERSTASGDGVLRWVVAAVGLVLAGAAVGLVVWSRATTPTELPDTGAQDAPGVSATATDAPTGDEQPASGQPADSDAPAEPPSAVDGGAGVSPEAARTAVETLLSAVHDGDVTAAQEVVSERFTDTVGGAEWFAAGPGGLKSWEVVSATADDGVVWVLTTETWDYGVQKSVYRVVGTDGRPVVDTIE